MRANEASCCTYVRVREAAAARALASGRPLTKGLYPQRDGGQPVAP